MSNIKDRIRELRKEKNLTQEELAKMLGLSAKSNIANYENGANAPSDEVKLKMCEIFNCSMDYLMGKTEYKTTNEMIDAYLRTQYEIDVHNAIINSEIHFLDSGLNSNQIVKTQKIIQDILLSKTTNENKGNKLGDLVNSFSGKQKKAIKEIIENILNYIASQEKYRNVYNSMMNIKFNNAINTRNQLFNIPVLGKIAAGQPILAEEYLEGYLPVDPNIYGMTTPDDYFYLKVSGESMNLKVHNGDYALIHKQDYAENGDIIVAIINGFDEATLKRYKKLSNELVMLEPMSTYPMEPIVINLKGTKFQIIGKAIGQFGKF